MNNYEQIILFELFENKNRSQREISELTNISLGLVNKTLKELRRKEYIETDNTVTLKGKNLLVENEPSNAIILAAGAGLRMAPVGNEVSKGLLKVNGEILVERLINQLIDSNINDITIVTGFQKEKYEYLKDKYNVNLVFNKHYLVKNNAYSLSLVKNMISNTYILPCDIFVTENVFQKNEIGSWYGVVDIDKENSFFSLNRKNKMIEFSNLDSIEMTGIGYINKQDGILIKKTLSSLSEDEERDWFWENTLSSLVLDNRVRGKVIPENIFFEINNYEHLRSLDAESENLTSRITKLLEEIFDTNIKNIKNIEIMKTGMTNRSFKFSFNDECFIMRIPGFGTNKLINRTEEMEVYKIVSNELISDELIYISDKNGFKVTKYIPDSRVCDPLNDNDVKLSMRRLREFHDKKLKVEHTFNLKEKIQYYEDLLEGADSSYNDYLVTKTNIDHLLEIVGNMNIDKTLCHIDSVPDNFLFYKDGIKLIDWEYGAMQDPHLDIAMFAIYAIYNKEQVDNLVKFYFGYIPEKVITGKIYAYIAISGLLWSNWCEYKKMLGSDFGEYSIAQYRYAVDYYNLAINIFREEGLV